MATPDLATVRELFQGLYAVRGPLDWNGLSLVYEGERDGRPAVLALLPIDFESSPTARATFEVRAKALEGLANARLVAVTGHGMRHGVPFLELEHWQAETLAQELHFGPLDRKRALAIAHRVLKALELLEAVGVPHWDLTPANVLLHTRADGEDEVRLVGTGFAQLLRATRSVDQTGPTGKGSGASAGRYLAPELLANDPADRRADIFSVGALLWHMVSGSPPGKGSNPPGDLATIIQTAMARAPEQRYPTASAMRHALEGMTGQHHITVAPPVPSTPLAELEVEVDVVGTEELFGPGQGAPKGRGLRVAAFVLLLLGLAGGGVALWLHWAGADGSTEMTTADPREEPIAATAPPTTPSGGAEGATEPGEEEPTPPLAPPDAEDPPEGSAEEEPDDAEVVDLLAGELPEELRAVQAQVEAEERLSLRVLRPIGVYASEHQDDPRPHLLIARAFVNLRWHSDAIERYLQAYRADPACRADSRMLDDLIEMASRPNSGPAASVALVRIYGAEAIPRLDQRLEEPFPDPELRRLRNLRSRLER